MVDEYKSAIVSDKLFSSARLHHGKVCCVPGDGTSPLYCQNKLIISLCAILIEILMLSLYFTSASLY